MNDKGLGSILAQGEARLAELTPDPPVPEGEGRVTLRDIATFLGHDPEKVLRRYDDGGALADLIRTMLNIEQRQPGRSGAPRSDEVTATFLQYLLMASDGLSKRQAIRRLASQMGVEEETIKKRIERGLKRTKGPGGIAELYSMLLKSDPGDIIRSGVP